MGVDEIRASIGADSLGYISLEELVESSQQPAEQLCRACFDGIYPVEIPESARLGKLRLEPTVNGAQPVGSLVGQ
jgi:amidophosphoribosyltransferase